MSEYFSSARCIACPWSWGADSDDDLANAEAEIAAEQHAEEMGHPLLLTQVIHPLLRAEIA